jgi:hypothetical protein
MSQWEMQTPVRNPVYLEVNVQRDSVCKYLLHSFTKDQLKTRFKTFPIEMKITGVCISHCDIQCQYYVDII